MSTKNGRISTDSAEIYYELSGNTAGKPLLLLHGGLGSMDEFHGVHEFLSPDHFIVSIDFRGHGKSTLGDLPLSYAQYQQDVETILKYLEIDHYSIFGFSDGGIVGYRLAASHPGQVEKLITLGAQWHLVADSQVTKILQSVTAEFWTQRFSQDVEKYNTTNPHPDIPKLVEAVRTVWLDMTENGYPGQSVGRITCPTLIMRGDNDFLFLMQEALELKQQIKGSSFANIPLTAHASHQESPEIIGKIVHQFLSQ
ncbi:alpha/beta fold hydrolase [Vibrio mangrovi]|uniref:Alpha/beta hydrolase n=1 Tax=Vibrio mangrovi TaxID=474394 RepID=A0A1Y6IZI7_9VIBR|nr:alpha/beta hydrolase [Vibrio mangrovi]MDW6005344.1 alpha/beta hydrolase [Vibrio mangrovi]SMS03056.1 Tropinesterase [Vibrio mangrovi]